MVKTVYKYVFLGAFIPDPDAVSKVRGWASAPKRK